MNNYKEFLPVGSVVRLKGGKKNIMVTGFCAVSNEDKKMYDYCACLYPEGVLSSEMNLLFNHDKIEEIIFKGYESPDEVNFKNKLNEMIKQKNQSGELNQSSNNSASPLPQMQNNNNIF